MVKPQRALSSIINSLIVEVLILWSSRNQINTLIYPNKIVEVLILWSSRNTYTWRL